MWKKFYKKATALALVCAMSVMLTACGDSNSSWKAASSSLENSVEDAIAAGNTKPEASPIDASSLEDCAYALPDPTGEEAKAETSEDGFLRQDRDSPQGYYRCHKAVALLARIYRNNLPRRAG